MYSCSTSPQKETDAKRPSEVTDTTTTMEIDTTPAPFVPIKTWGQDTTFCLYNKPTDIDTVIYTSTDTLFIAVEVSNTEKFITGEFNDDKVMITYPTGVRLIITNGQGDIQCEETFGPSTLLNQVIEKNLFQ